MDFGIEYGYWQARAEEDFSDTVGEYTRLICGQFPSYLAKFSYDRCDTAIRQAMTLSDRDLSLTPVDELSDNLKPLDLAKLDRITAIRWSLAETILSLAKNGEAYKTLTSAKLQPEKLQVYLSNNASAIAAFAEGHSEGYAAAIAKALGIGYNFAKIDNLSSLPDKPGVYLVSSILKEVIYVGKSETSVKRRLMQHNRATDFNLYGAASVGYLPHPVRYSIGELERRLINHKHPILNTQGNSKPVNEQQLKRWRSLVALIRGEYSMSF